MLRSPVLAFAAALLAVALLTAVGPAEKTLGTSVRVVYLHGVWVWTALLAFLAAALSGLLGLLTGRTPVQRVSLALGRTGLLFWITYLPISMWAMQTNWNGLFLAEPRWRLAAVFAIGGLVLQIGITLVDRLNWASAANLAYFIALAITLVSAENVMHPSSPIFGSGILIIQVYFLALLSLLLVAAWQLARWLYRLTDR
jgi:hypothetical protein